MKHRIPALILAAALLCPVGCQEKSPPLDLSAYTIVRPDNSTKSVTDSALSIRELTDLPISTDWVNRGETIPDGVGEILVGSTNRPLSNELIDELRSRENCLSDWAIAAKNGSVAIVGGSDEALSAAAEYFLSHTDELTENYSFIYRKEYETMELLGKNIGEYSFALPENANPDLRKAVKAFEADVLARTGFRMDGKNKITPGLSGKPDEWKISAGSGVSVTGGCYLSLIEALDNLMTLSDKLTADKPLTGNYTGDIPLALGEYTLVWNDEFDSDYTEKWTTLDHTYEGHEGGKAYRVKKDSTLWQEDGKLVLSAYRLEGHDYECAPYVWTKKKMLFNRGIVEMRGKLAVGKGLWSSFWMTGDVTFPEIDVFETKGYTNTLTCNIHKWGDKPDANGKTHSSLDGRVRAADRQYVLPSGNFDEDYHIFRLEWDVGVMRFYCDGELFCEQEVDDFFTDKYVAVVLSTLIGPHMIPEPDADAKLPVNYTVDWVRLYQKSGEGIQFFD